MTILAEPTNSQSKGVQQQELKLREHSARAELL